MICKHTGKGASDEKQHSGAGWKNWKPSQRLRVEDHLLSFYMRPSRPLLPPKPTGMASQRFALKSIKSPEQLRIW